MPPMSKLRPTAESAFSLLKRGIMGTWHNISAKHLQACLDEMVFRFNRRKNSDVSGYAPPHGHGPSSDFREVDSREERVRCLGEECHIQRSFGHDGHSFANRAVTGPVELASFK
ncbi:MAG: hypothetical protein DMG49_19220 [Acidobacteria bacterium]|nr:MAG: hypothetical protein DMG49_19220 [Acidobacteriota bacterium]